MYPDKNDQQDNLDIEFTDLPPDTKPGIGARLLLAGIRILAQLRTIRVTLRPEEEDLADDQCDFDLRIEEIPSAELPKPTQRKKHVWLNKHSRNIMFTTVFLLSLFAFLLISTPALPATLLSIVHLKPTPKITYTSEQDIPVLDPITVITATPGGWLNADTPDMMPAPLPLTCPGTAPTVSSGLRVGSTPLWITGFDGPTASIHIKAHHFISYGWEATLSVSYTAPMQLSISRQAQGRQPAFIITTLEDLSSSIQLDSSFTNDNPAQPHALTDSAGSQDIQLMLPGAGCYQIKASWALGQRTIPFAAGT